MRVFLLMRAVVERWSRTTRSGFVFLKKSLKRFVDGMSMSLRQSKWHSYSTKTLRFPLGPEERVEAVERVLSFRLPKKPLSHFKLMYVRTRRIKGRLTLYCGYEGIEKRSEHIC